MNYKDILTPVEIRIYESIEINKESLQFVSDQLEIDPVRVNQLLRKIERKLNRIKEI